jgi:lysozyme
MSNAKGIDVSHHQGRIDWKAVDAAGYSFAFVKATENADYADSRFTANWQDAKTAGFVRGAYHYFHPSLDPSRQAAFFVNTVGGWDPTDIPPALDVEISDQDAASLALSNTEWADRTSTCLSEIARLSGRVPIIYLTAWGRDVWKTKIAPSTAPSWANKYLLWVSSFPAAQPEILKGWSTWTFWQFDTKGKVNGIDGQVDLDQFNGTLEVLLQWLTPGQ